MTTDERLDRLETALARAQRRNRRLTVALGLVATAAALGGVMGAAQPAGGAAREVRATAFILEDAHGTVRARLSMGEDGPQLVLLDETGTPRAGLGVDKDGPDLTLADENGKIRAMLVVTKDGPRLALWDENDKIRAMLNVTKLGPHLALWDENDKLRAWLDVDKDGPRLTLRDEKGTGRASLGASQTKTRDGKTITYPESTLLLCDAEGKVLWVAPRP